MSEYIIHIEDAKTLYNLSNFTFPLDAYLRNPIVRCRDCALQDDIKYCERLGFKVGDDGYCAWPKRRDEC